MKYRYTVLSYDIGNYELFREIEEMDPEAEYVWVTDDKNLTSKTWTIVYDKDLEGMSLWDKCYSIRFNPFKYCHSDICLRIDGSIAIKKSLKPLIDIFEEGKYDMALMPHPVRNNFLEEYQVWVDYRGYDPKQAERFINDMREKGYDFNYKGMFQLCFWIQRKRDEIIELNNRTMAYMRELGPNGTIDRMDQIPFSYIANVNYSYLKILPVSEQIVRSAYMQWFMHKSLVPNVNIEYNILEDDVQYMFNKPTKCLYMLPLNQKDALKRIQFLEKEIKEGQGRESHMVSCAETLSRENNFLNENYNSLLNNNNELKNQLHSMQSESFQMQTAINSYKMEINRYQMYFNYRFIKIIYKLIRAYRKHVKKESVY